MKKQIQSNVLKLTNGAETADLIWQDDEKQQTN
jgi:hypothetical protein